MCLSVCMYIGHVCATNSSSYVSYMYVYLYDLHIISSCHKVSNRSCVCAAGHPRPPSLPPFPPLSHPPLSMMIIRIAFPNPLISRLCRLSHLEVIQSETTLLTHSQTPPLFPALFQIFQIIIIKMLVMAGCWDLVVRDRSLDMSIQSSMG